MWRRTSARLLIGATTVVPTHESTRWDREERPGCGTGRRILRRHTPDQAPDFGCRRGASDEAASRRPGPELPKPRSVPAHHRVGSNDDQRILPPWPEATERELEEPIARSHPRTRSPRRDDGELLAEGESFDQQVGPRRRETSEPTQEEGDSGEHLDRMAGPGVAVRSDVCKPLSVSAEGVLAKHRRGSALRSPLDEACAARLERKKPSCRPPARPARLAAQSSSWA